MSLKKWLKQIFESSNRNIKNRYKHCKVVRMVIVNRKSSNRK